MATVRPVLIAGGLAGPVLAAALAGGHVPPVAAHTAGQCPADTRTDRCETWAAVFDDATVGPPHRSDQFVTATAVTDQAVYTTVKNVALDPADPYSATGSWLVLAYDAATGDRKWRAERRTRVYDMPLDVVVSPDGSRVYVTGAAYDAFPVSATDSRVVTVAYDAATGSQVWAAEWDNLPDGTDNGKVITVAPDGSEVYVGGITTTAAGDLDYLMIGYDTRHGRRLWATTYAGPAESGSDALYDIAADPSGRLLYATGASNGVREYDLDYTTLAVRTGRGRPGSVAWVARYDGAGRHKPDRARALAVSPDGGTVVVTGNSWVPDADGSTGYDAATVAYSPSGDQLWQARYAGPGPGIAYDSGSAVVATEDLVVVTGQSAGESDDDGLDVATVAYHRTTGEQRWVHREDQSLRSELPEAVDASPSGHRLYVLSTARPTVPYTALDTMVLHAYRSGDGAEEWTSRLDAGAGNAVSGDALAVAPGGSVVVAGLVTRSQSPVGPPSQNRYDAVTARFAPLR